MKSVGFVFAPTLLCLPIAFSQQPLASPSPSPASATAAATASGAAGASASTACPPGSATSPCAVQVIVNNNPAPTPSPSPTPRPPKGSTQMRLVTLNNGNDKCACPDDKQTAAIAKRMDTIVPGAHVKAAGPGILAIEWEDTVADQAEKELEALAQKLFESRQLLEPDTPAPTSPLIYQLKNHNHKAQVISNRLASSVLGITVAAIPNDEDDALVITFGKDTPKEAIENLLKIIESMDAPDTVGYASSHIIRLYNMRKAADIAKILNNFQAGGQKVTVANQGDDVLVLTGSAPGSEAVIDELKRYVAVLDLPRPQLALNLWSVQVSSKNLDDVNDDSARVRKIVNTYNSLLTDSYDRGWRVISYLRDHSKNWQNQPFVDYVSKRFIACSPFYKTAKDKNSQLCFAGDSGSPPTKGAPTRDSLHACSKGEYCLGYTFALDPSKPSLSNLFFALAASDTPGPLASEIVTCMESDDPNCGSQAGKRLSAVNRDPQQCRFTLEPEKACTSQNQEKELRSPLENVVEAQKTDCEGQDQDAYEKDRAGQQKNEQASQPNSSLDAQNGSSSNELVSRKLHFACLREELQTTFSSSRKTGQMRAAIADFLFHYKMLNEYPHNFVPYDVSHSADTLDSHFHPLLAAYNRDVVALLRFLQKQRLRANEFASEGIVTVSVISGNAAAVDAKTANSFESTTPFTIAEYLNQLKAAESNLPALLKSNLTTEEATAIMAAFNVQKPTTISIGRDLSLNAAAFSLATGSAAELKVTMAAKDDGQPQQTFAGNTKNDINPSRVAAHTVDTTVRVESTRLFELSSLSARLTYRGNSWPIPIVGELPWIGPAFRWPGTVHRVFHRSFAIISAVVVPNAADLALGMPFTGDRMLGIPDPKPKPCSEPPARNCLTKSSECHEKEKACPDPADRMQELGVNPLPFTEGYHAQTLTLDALSELAPQVREFHKEKLRCFISIDFGPNCKNLQLNNFPEDGPGGDKNTEEP